MSSTNYTVGLGNEGKMSSKILKPPGGGSSDIFGTGFTGAQAENPRRVNNSQMRSTVFDHHQTPSESAIENRNKAGNGSMRTIFGFGGVNLPSSDDQSSPRKVKNNYMKSSVFDLKDESAAVANRNCSNNNNIDQPDGKETAPPACTRPSESGDNMTARQESLANQANQAGGNPITGEGYKGEMFGPEEPAQLAAVRVRNPPGGHSTKLW